MPKPTDRDLMCLIREHLDTKALLAAHPELKSADLDAFWTRHGLGKPAPRELFDAPVPQANDPNRPLHLVARCDGAARGNPGPASIGAVLADKADGQTVLEISEAIGRQTNNVAEYTAVLRAVEKALEVGATEMTLLLDSNLLVNQLRGTYRVKAPHLKPLHQRARALLGHLQHWDVHHVPRAQNAAADRLANLALDRKRT